MGTAAKALLEPRNWPRSLRIAILILVCAGPVFVLFFLARVPIGPHYHDFADKRTLWGIPNALDALSNVPFCLVGIWALISLLRRESPSIFLDRRERIPWVIFFAGVTLTGLGSYWYHLAPSDDRLPWDLLPMTCSFLSLIAVTYMERVSLRAGFAALGPLLLLGMATVLYWAVTTAHGHGDYKFYLAVEFFSPVVLACIVALFPPRYSGMRYLVAAFAFFVAAKLLETYDFGIYRRSHLVSGHSLKHVTAAVACVWILRMLQVRHPVARDVPYPVADASEPTDAVTFAEKESQLSQ
ncbi:MAG TPA: hypothetical protein VIY53_03070 [Acidobacteriaceae bacterium]